MLYMGINIALLYMFNRALWTVNKRSLSVVDVEMPCQEIQRSTSSSLAAVVDSYKGKRESGVSASQSELRIIKRHNVMKKQTILVSIAIVSTTIYTVWAGITSSAVYEFGWDACVNTICVWMMLSSSKRYWNLCKDYGVCRCCFYHTGDLN